MMNKRVPARYPCQRTFGMSNRAGTLFANPSDSFAYLRFFMAIILIEYHMGIWYNISIKSLKETVENREKHSRSYRKYYRGSVRNDQWIGIAGRHDFWCQ